ncbi:MAG: MBL fold metallo-hydrolase [Firmicutes bacterium]|nr:MBL fold metallo-hydrolase [Bacillota bacterium]
MKIERIACGAVNCFIVSQGDSAILVDTAQTAYRERILEKCRAKHVKLIVLTHGHYDHAQNAAWLAAQLGVPVAMHAADVPLLAQAPLPKARTLLGYLLVGGMWLQQAPVAGPVVSRLLDNAVPAFEPAVLLRDGDSLAAYGVDAVVLALPGHTMGSIGLLVGDSNLLVGDALMNILRPQKAPHYLDRAAMERSAERLSAFGGGAVVHFGHGGSVTNRSW